ncbi:MAG: hypothetical protein U5K43_14000 [Halofilum sp. (in: g-proteobacteria)]|nr:hypothetical protein [Halofilum sp. (in: g-proteobacteria)]
MVDHLGCSSLIPFAVLLGRMFAGWGSRRNMPPALPSCAACGALLFDADLLTGSAPRGGGAAADTRCITAGRQVALIGSIIFCASLVIGVLGITGLGVKITSLILSALRRACCGPRCC